MSERLRPEDVEILATYTSEGLELLDSVEPRLVEIEEAARTSGGVDREALDAVFRLVHNLKSSSGYLGLQDTARLAHGAESVLGAVRSGTLAVEPAVVDLLIRACDALKARLAYTAAHGSDEPLGPDQAALEQELCRLVGRAQQAVDAAPAAVVREEVGQGQPERSLDTIFRRESREQLDTADEACGEIERGGEVLAALARVRRSLHGIKGNAAMLGSVEVERLAEAAEQRIDPICAGRTPPPDDLLTVVRPVLGLLRGALLEDRPISAVQLEFALSMVTETLGESADGKARAGQAAAAAVPRARAQEASHARVGLDKLDLLMDLVGELVIAESAVRQSPDIEGLELPRFEKSIRLLNKITRELQDATMDVRMVPIAGTFRRLLRVVRDAAHKSGKEVDLVLQGEHTEMDRTIIEQVTAPLVHIVRNAVDHGIEPAVERREAGKTERGTIEVAARQIGGEIWLTVRDDGGGFDRERILARAAELGLLDDTVATLRDSEVWALTLIAGFSTVRNVTDISGRGVGLDVVARNVERLRGRVEIRSQRGQGSTFLLRIPLTLAIIEAMLVRVAAAVFAIPLTSIVQCFQEGQSAGLTTPDGQEHIRRQDDVVPVLDLQCLFGLERRAGRVPVLVLVEQDGRRVCLRVDELLGQHQVVVKPLPAYLGRAHRVSGCSILGDGSLCLILDVEHMASQAERTDPQPGVERRPRTTPAGGTHDASTRR